MIVAMMTGNSLNTLAITKLDAILIGGSFSLFASDNLNTNPLSTKNKTTAPKPFKRTLSADALSRIGAPINWISEAWNKQTVTAASPRTDSRLGMKRAIALCF
jgi:hypothetical protein